MTSPCNFTSKHRPTVHREHRCEARTSEVPYNFTHSSVISRLTNHLAEVGCMKFPVVAGCRSDQLM